MEEFRDIKGYEGLYQVSNLGRVKSLSRTIYKVDGTTQTFKDKIRSSTFNGRGYLQLGLTKNGKCKTCKVHRLVSETFIPNIEGKKEVNHLDGNKANNILSNLEWCTPSENVQHAYDTGLKVAPKGENNTNSKFNNQDILDIRASNDLHRVIAERYNVTRPTISSIKSRKTWKHI
tara:strand:+ start:168 stop:692 length:525 start_codon:yes stop_codon:yes gene_type:complete